MDIQRLIPLVPKERIGRSDVGYRQFGTGETSRLLGVPIRSVLYWATEGLIKPFIAGAGQGARRAFSVENLVEIAIYHELSRLSCSIGTMMAVRNKLREAGYFANLASRDRDHEVAQIYLDESGEIVLKNGTPLPENGMWCGAAIVLNLPFIERRVEQAIARHDER